MAGEDDHIEDMGTSRSPSHGVGSDEELVLESLLSGEPTRGLPEDLKRVEALLAAASAPPGMNDFAGLGAALAVHDRMVPDRSVSRVTRKPVLVGIAAAVAAVMFGGVGAAYAGALPDTIQDFAHRTIGAPSADGPGKPGNGDPGNGDPGNGVGNPGEPGPGDGPAGVGPSSTPAPRSTDDTAVGPDGKATPPGQVKRTEKATPPGQVERTEKATPKGQVQRTVKATPRGQVQRTATVKPSPTNKGKGNNNGNSLALTKGATPAE